MRASLREGLPFRSAISTFLWRCVNWKLVDWDGTWLQIARAATQPQRLAQLAAYRQHTTGRMAREDPGVVLLLLYSSIATSLVYGVTLIASHEVLKPDLALASTRHKFVVLIWGFMIWPVLVLAVSCGVLTVALWLGLREFAKLKRQSLALELSKQLQAFVPARTLPPPETTITRPFKLEIWYCFDIVCNASVPGLGILALVQFLFLPLIISAPSSYLGDVLICMITNGLFHGGSTFVFAYSVAQGVSVLPAPLWKSAPLVFVLPMSWICLLLLLSLFRINMTRVMLHVLFGWLFPTSSAPSGLPVAALASSAAAVAAGGLSNMIP